MKKTKLFSYSKINAVCGAMSTLFYLGEADAGVVYFDVNPDLQFSVSRADFGQIDLNTVTYSLDSQAGSYFGFVPISTGFYMGSDGGMEFLVENGFYAVGVYRDREISGALIGGDIAFSNFSGASITAGNEASGPTFIPLRLDAGGGDFNYGWVQIFSNGGTYTVTGFAFEKDVNTPILAGDIGSPAAAVPEPGSLAVVSGLFGLMVAANRRARKRNEASAPDSLLNLASGARGVQKLREESAA